MNGIPVARVLGFEIRIHASWVLIIALVAVLVVGELELLLPNAGMAVRWAVGAVVAASFLLSVLAHELGHGLAARRRGIDVGPITLYAFGGSSSFHLESERPRDEAAIAVAGPSVSLVIGACLGLVGLASNASRIPALEALGGVTLVLAALNIVLGVANLVPAYPLDGGRLVRAAVWARTGDERRGSKAAATSGRVVGWILIGAGFALMLRGDSADGVMLALSGWFLGGAARSIVRGLAVQDLLTGVRVGDVMERGVSGISPNLTVDTFAAQLLQGAAPALPVVADGVILGLVSASQVRRLRRGKWAATRAEDLMIAPPALPVVAVGDTLWSALDGLRRTGLDGLPVVEDAGLLGIVTRDAIAATIQSRARLRGVTLR